MKNWKKLVAILLAGVMALAMLTACGGVEMYHDQAAEQAVTKAVSEKKGGSFEANKTLNDIAWKALVKVDTSDNSIKWFGKHFTETVDGKKVYINIATIGSVNKGDDSVSVDNVTTVGSDALLKWMEAHGLFHETDFKFENNWVNVGLAVGKKDGQMYIAVAVGVNW